MTKKELRAAMRGRNLGMAPAERAEASRRIFGRVGRLEAFGAARTVGFFCSLRDEPDTAEALVRWSAVKRIVVPRVEGDAMRFYRYDPQTLRPARRSPPRESVAAAGGATTTNTSRSRACTP